LRSSNGAIQGLARALRARLFVFERAMPDTAPQQACLVCNGAYGTGLNTVCGDSPNAFCSCEGYLRSEALVPEAKWSTKASLKRSDIHKHLCRHQANLSNLFSDFRGLGSSAPRAHFLFAKGGFATTCPLSGLFGAKRRVARKQA